MSKYEVSDAIMTQAIHAAIQETGLIDIISKLDFELKAAKEENARLRADVARLENLQEFWHGCVVLARKQLEETSQRLDKWIKERPTNDQ